jgi:hypothetical protein
MSLAELLSHIPRFTRAERLVLLREVLKLDDDTSPANDGLKARRVDGRLLLVGSRSIRQEEVDAILEEFP